MKQVLKRLHDDKALQQAWSDFIMAELNDEALARVYKGKDTSALAEARKIIAKSFAKLNAMFTPAPKSRDKSRAV